MTQGHDITRRTALALGGGAAALTMAPLSLRAAAPAEAAGAWRHGYSPLGNLAYPQGFAAFGYVNPNAPKGGTLRLARAGTFDTVDTLHYPGLPPRDIRLIYDRLVVRSDDEAASYYGVLARDIAVADDFSEIVFTLHPEARWHDGRPLTAEDVVFTFETLKAEGVPFFRQALLPLTATAEADDTVRLINTRTGYRDVIRQITNVPIHPAHVWRDRSGPDIRPVGSGPYRVADVDVGRLLVLERVPDYWAADLGVNRGRWNFDRLTIEYYRDEAVALEAFRADEYDLRTEESPIRWHSGYNGSALDSGAIRRAEGPRQAGDMLHGLVFNLRRPLLADRRVRLALTLAHDFETMNRVLFAGAYTRLDSVFGDTELAARGAADGAERAFLDRLGDAVPDGVLADPDPLSGLPQPGTREALSEASRLLNEAGLDSARGVRIDPTTGEPVTLRLVLASPRRVYDRPLTWITRAFDRLGIGVSRVQADPALSARILLDRDFDIATLSWSPAPLPGSAERLLWHSALAAMPDSYALSGITSPALDAAIEALESARSQDALTTAGRAFDRVFRHAAVMLPLWRSSEAWIAWWNRFERPEAEEAWFPASPIDRWWAV